MSIDITMPRLSDTMESGTILKWNVKEGDAVAAGDVVADVETDKATMELQRSTTARSRRSSSARDRRSTSARSSRCSPRTGEDRREVAADRVGRDQPNGDGGRAKRDEPPATTPPPKRRRAPVAADRRRRRAGSSPVARRLADEHGVDARPIAGSGPGGRVIKRDVLAAIDAAERDRGVGAAVGRAGDVRGAEP